MGGPIPAGVIISPLQRKKYCESPSYNDFMNSMFATKTHQSYRLRQKADMRTKYLENLFSSSIDRTNADDQRILAEQENKKQRDDLFMTERINNRNSWAMKTKEFQIKQM